MKRKAVVSIVLVLVMLFTAAAPTLALAGTARAVEVGAAAGDTAAEDASGKKAENAFIAFFRELFDKIKRLWNRMLSWSRVRREKVRNTFMQNAIHMLRSVTDTIGDSFIITTEDGKVMVVDGGHYSETPYFIEYLKAATGQKKPHIDAWFLSHPHDDHCEVFLEVAERYADVVTFDKVYANFPDASFYEGYDEWCVAVISEFDRLRPAFADKVVRLSEGDVFRVGAAKFTVFFAFDDEDWRDGNSASTVMRMDLGGTSVMLTGDATQRVGDYVVDKYGDTGLLRCDYCKMAHHGQDGVGRNFYEAVSPEVCLWPTPTWVYENANGNLTTFETREWVASLGVKKEYKSFEGTQVIPMIPRIVTTTDVFEDGYPAETAAERLAKLGYEGIDMGFDYWTFDGSPFLADDYLDWAKSLRSRADAVGVPYTHAHAPGEADNFDYAVRSIRAASVLGARYLVVHPVFRDKNGNTINTKLRFLSVNADAIRKLLPVAEECGVVLLSENILWGASADPRIIADLVKCVDSPWFGWCFDVGHAYCQGYAPSVLTRCCVAPRSVHIQDNDGTGDGHLIPGDGTIDWNDFIRSLKAVGYLGDCVLEAHHQSLEAPDDQRDAILARLLDTAVGLREQMR